MSSVSVRDVRKSYGASPVLHGVSVDIADGEFVILVGPSGCGKSTLLRMIAGLETITGGEIRIGSRVVNNVPPKERDIAMVFQNYALYPHMSVRQNLAYGLTNRRTPRDEIARRVAAAADILEIGPLLDRRPRALSGGQRQRVAMGRAIVREPAAFLFDEPLSNLDAKLRVTMRGEIRILQRRLGTTSIYVTHDQMEAMTLADRLVVLNGGRIEQVGRPLDVYRRPASAFVAAFIGSPAMNLLAAASDGGGLRVGPTRLAERTGGTGPVTIGIRPEDLRPAQAGAGDALALHVDYVEELGASRLVHGRVEGQRLVWALPAGGEVEPHVRLQPIPGALHLFDPVTGMRLIAEGG